VHRPATRDRTESLLRLHVYPVLGDRPIGGIRASAVQSFVSTAAGALAPSTLRMAYSVVSAVFASAVRDRVIPASPCEGVRLPEARRRKVQPPGLAVLDALAAALPERFRAVVPLVAGSGLRQGELFGLEVVGVDFLRGRHVEVDQQLVSPSTGAPYLGPPKTPESERTVPLAQVTLDALAAHLAAWPATEVEVEDRTDPRAPRRRSARLLFTLDGGRPVARNVWSAIWMPAARAAGLPPRTGLHVVRHWYASALIRHGASVNAVQARLGHSSAGVTLDVYGHLWPDDDDTTRDALTAALSVAAADSVRTEARS
jgi:integrase